MQGSGADLDIISERRPGILSRLIIKASQCGLTVIKNEILPLDSERQRIRFRLAAGWREVSDLKQQMGSVEGVLEVERLLAHDPPAQDLQLLLRQTYQDLVDAKTEQALVIVRRFELELSSEIRSRCLVSLGRKIGNQLYHRSYSLGSPLALKAGLNRIVIPCLSNLAPTRLNTEQRLVVEPCPFCRDPEVEPSCAYFSGLAQGLLELAPTTAAVKVTETRCSHRSPYDSCIFEITT